LRENSNLNTNIYHKGLYTMGRNTKRPNGPMKPKQKHYKKYKSFYCTIWS